MAAAKQSTLLQFQAITGLLYIFFELFFYIFFLRNESCLLSLKIINPDLKDNAAAESFLSACNWNVEEALNLFLANPDYKPPPVKRSGG